MLLVKGKPPLQPMFHCRGWDSAGGGCMRGPMADRLGGRVGDLPVLQGEMLADGHVHPHWVSPWLERPPPWDGGCQEPGRGGLRLLAQCLRAQRIWVTVGIWSCRVDRGSNPSGRFSARLEPV